MAKSAQRLEARRLRSKGLSIKEITIRVGGNRGSVGRWCEDIILTNKQKEKLIENCLDGRERGRLKASAMKIEERKKRLNKFKLIGINKVNKISKRELFLLGISIYWAEGCKKHRRVLFSNSDPAMVKMFIYWLRHCLKIGTDCLVCTVGINQIHRKRIGKVEEYWSETLGIPLSQFSKTSFKKVINKKTYANYENYFGTLSIKVRKSTNLNYEVLGYIEGLKQNLELFDKIEHKAG